MRALVSGGAGFIGSHLVDALVGRGDRVLVLDDLSSGRRGNLAGALKKGAALAEGDLADRDFVRAQVEDFAPDRAFHLAAQVDVRKSVADPAFDARINLLGTINLLEALRGEAAAAPVVFASTGGAIYGEGDGRDLPLAEAAEAAPEAPYGASKLAGEQYLALYRRIYEQPTVSMRFANVYGPRQDPHGEAGVVAIFCGLLREGRPLRVFGDGMQTRDYVYVGDVVTALIAADERLGAGATPAGPFNVGTGVETTVLDLVQRLGRIAGTGADVEHAPARLGEVARISIDPDAAARELGWEPATSLDAGLRATYEALGEASARSANTM